MLRVEGLATAYGKRRVLRGVDLEVRAGELTALVGPNGCGKTTLIKALTRLVPWTSGRALVGEAHLGSLTTRETSRLIAVVPQATALPAGYTATEVVLMGRTPYLGVLESESQRDYEIAGRALARVGASALAERPVDELSGGERQMVLLARAIAQETPVLLLDEPTANLDIGHQMAIAGLMRALASDGVTVMAAMHDLALASLYADQIALMSEGRVVTTGRPEEVLTASNLARVYGAEVTVLTSARGRPVVLPLQPEASSDNGR
jgi:iron complex transport system ATP-binding protein